MSRHEEGGGERPAEEAKIVAPRAREETHSAGRVFDFEGSGGEGGAGQVATRGGTSGFWSLINLILSLINAFEFYLTF